MTRVNCVDNTERLLGVTCEGVLSLITWKPSYHATSHGAVSTSHICGQIISCISW